MTGIADLHTHTIASTHAYSTILENALQASKRGLLYLATTDHGPAMEGLNCRGKCRKYGKLSCTAEGKNS